MGNVTLKELREEYQKASKKYKVPDFDELNEHFEFMFLSQKDFILRLARRRMTEKLIFFMRILENILYPSQQSPIAAYESGFFTEEQKKKLLDLHRKMMVFERQSIAIDISPSEKRDVDYINKLWTEWPKFSKIMDEVSIDMEKAWQQEYKKEEGEKYFG